MATTEPMQQRIAAMAQMLVEEFDDVDESLGDCWLDAVEQQTVALTDALAAELLQRSVARRAVAVDASCPTCGQLGQHQGDRERALIGRRGPVTIPEPEYYCPGCRKAFFPADASFRHGD